MAVVSSGTTIIDNGAFDPAIPTGALTLIKSITASSSASIEFINGTSGVVLDGTYSSYVFSFIDIHPQNDVVNFQFQTSTNGGSSYGVTITSTSFRAEHYETGVAPSLVYTTDNDQAQTTNFQNISYKIGNDNDQTGAGTLILYNPSSTTFVKHFIAVSNSYFAAGGPPDASNNSFNAGYFNTTSAINAIQFKFDSGNIDDGIIKLYGVK